MRREYAIHSPTPPFPSSPYRNSDWREKPAKRDLVPLVKINTTSARSKLACLRSKGIPPAYHRLSAPPRDRGSRSLHLKEGASQHRSTIDGAAATMAAGGGRPGGAARAALRVRQRAVPRAAAGHDLCSRARVRAGQLHVRELLRPWSRLPLRRRLLRARDGADRERHGRAPAPPGGLPRPRGAPRRPERRARGRGLQGPRMSSESSRSLPRR